MRSLKISSGFTKCYYNYQTKEEDVGHVACTYVGQITNPHKTSVGRSEGKRLLGSPRCSEGVILK
jgi:hypothetical protein